MLAANQRQLGITERRWETMASLGEENLLPQSELDAVESQFIDAMRGVIDFETVLLQTQEEQELAIVECDLQLVDLEAELALARAERVQITSEVSLLEAQRNREIMAPVSGIVTFRDARNYQSVVAEQPLFRMVPAGVEFVATVLAPSSAIGFVKGGDRVTLRYDAYPHREHGVFAGEVVEIDNTAQIPSKIGAPVGGDAPAYRIYARIDQAPINKDGQPLRLVSGMTFEAAVIADEKPILFWLLDPLF